MGKYSPSHYQLPFDPVVTKGEGQSIVLTTVSPNGESLTAYINGDGKTVVELAGGLTDPDRIEGAIQSLEGAISLAPGYNLASSSIGEMLRQQVNIFNKHHNDIERAWDGDFDGINSRAADAAKRGGQIPRRDPLALDLNGNGIETTNTAPDGSPILFDHNADGVKTGTGWLKPSDGWLVRDLNYNGKIDSGRELFGVDTQKQNGTLASNGFDALSELDSNGDGKIDAQDAAFAELKIWRDLNQNGETDAGELFDLNAYNISAINLTYTASNILLADGNVQAASGSFVRNDGSQGATGEFTSTAANLELSIDTFHREFTTSIPLTVQALSLPDIKGSGQVRDLREAISLDANLGNQVEAFLHDLDRVSQKNRIDAIMQK